MPNVFGIADDIIVIRYDNNGADHNAVVQQHATEMWRDQTKIKQRKMPF